MANTNDRIWEIMGIDPMTGTGTYKNRMGLSNTITRDNGIPLDISSIHETYNDAVVYAATNAIAYVGQVISAAGEVYIVTEEPQGTVKIDTYRDSITGKIVITQLKDYNIYIKPVGAINKVRVNGEELPILNSTIDINIPTYELPTATKDRIGGVKASKEIVVDEKTTYREVEVDIDGTMSIGGLSTDKLVQGKLSLVLNGGNADVINV